MDPEALKKIAPKLGYNPDEVGAYMDILRAVRPQSIPQASPLTAAPQTSLPVTPPDLAAGANADQEAYKSAWRKAKTLKEQNEIADSWKKAMGYDLFENKTTSRTASIKSSGDEIADQKAYQKAYEEAISDEDKTNISNQWKTTRGYGLYETKPEKTKTESVKMEEKNKNISNLLKTLEELKALSDKVGVGQVIAGKFGMNPDAKEFERKRMLAAKFLSNILEGGRMSDKDQEFYNKIVNVSPLGFQNFIYGDIDNLKHDISLYYGVPDPKEVDKLKKANYSQEDIDAYFKEKGY